MPLAVIYRFIIILPVAVIGPRSNVTSIDCTFSWCCLLTCGLYNCCKTKSDDNYDEAISAQEKDPDPLDQSQHPTEVKITTEGSTTENDTDKYKVYKREGVGDIYTYKFNDGVKCTKITQSGKEMWKLESSSTSGPQSFSYNKTDNSFTLLFQDELYIYTVNTTGEKWEGVMMQCFDLDTNNTNSNDNYDYLKVETYKHAFIAKEGKGFKSLKYKEKKIWAMGDIILAKAVLVSLGKDNSYVAIVFTDGNFQVIVSNREFNTFNKSSNEYTVDQLKNHLNLPVDLLEKHNVKLATNLTNKTSTNPSGTPTTPDGTTPAS